MVQRHTSTTLSLCPSGFYQNGGVFWTKGELFILGGQYFKNSAIETGGAIFASEESSITLKNGTFNQNRAIDGGVVYVDETAALFIEGGTLTANIADNRGGAFYIGVMGELNVSGQSKLQRKWIAQIRIEKGQGGVWEEVITVCDHETF